MKDNLENSMYDIIDYITDEIYIKVKKNIRNNICYTIWENVIINVYYTVKDNVIFNICNNIKKEFYNHEINKSIYNQVKNNYIKDII